MFDDWKILVVGGGTMGHGIALEFAVHGFTTALVDISGEKLAKAQENIAEDLETLIRFGEISREAADRAEALITLTEDLEEVAPNANFVSEAVFESPDAKRPIYDKLDRLCSPDCILSSSTSALNIFDIAHVSRPERLVIAHYFNPPHVMPLVEVVKGPRTSDETVERVVTLLKYIGTTPALIKQYIPGFIVNRLSSAIARETSYMITQGWVTADDIDSALCTTFGLRYPFEGPLQLQDYVGWDVIMNVSAMMFPELCNSAGPNPLAAQLVSRGCLGVKTGRGLRNYTGVDIPKMQRERIAKILKIRQAVKALNGD
ncbi:MAG: 3-hydroxyacyl-CoA dehydrogenase family protein [Syntrophales bacterium]|nr:3-hydroxyacyl-CoA dehydrogenase family protein [Syntrophales bacterium]